MNWLKLPQTKSIVDLDHPSATAFHAEIINSKQFLKRMYINFYHKLKQRLPEPANTIIELGSGGGFVKDVIPNVQTSDVLKVDGLDHVFSALEIPFDNTSVDAFIMIDVLHHISDPEKFFKEADRCLIPGGKIIMIEPANTVWSRFIFKNFHHENFDPDADWELSSSGPLSQANGAVPWIIFKRDRQKFLSKFPALQIIDIDKHTPLIYLLSGGLSLRQLVPSCSYGFFAGLEALISPVKNLTAMFQTIEVKKRLACNN